MSRAAISDRTQTNQGDGREWDGIVPSLRIFPVLFCSEKPSLNAAWNDAMTCRRLQRRCHFDFKMVSWIYVLRMKQTRTSGSAYYSSSARTALGLVGIRVLLSALQTTPQGITPEQP